MDESIHHTREDHDGTHETDEAHEAMEPMKPATPWWPDDLGQPDTSGAQNDLRYAYFASRHRLAVSRGGKATVYDTGEYEVRGVQQQQGGEGADLTFSSQNGEVPLSRLKLVNS